jgi:hypothetical protein
MPEYVDFYISEDGENFIKAGTIQNTISQQESSPVISNFKLPLNEKKVRYIKIFAKNIETCPDWHSGKNGKAFIFFDEIIVR